MLPTGIHVFLSLAGHVPVAVDTPDGASRMGRGAAITELPAAK